MSNFINNDTIALFFLGIVACGALVTGNPDEYCFGCNWWIYWFKGNAKQATRTPKASKKGE